MSARLRVGCAVLLGWGATLALTYAAAAETRALIVGIDSYAEASRLHGAVNDARDLDQVLAKRAVKDRRMLLDAAATRAAFDKEWAELIARSVPGDVVVFSFAGHGIRTPERGAVRRTPDGYDKGFILHPYQQDKQPRELLRDEELYDLFKVATDKGVKVVFVADACHSGGAVRSTDVLRSSGLGARVHRFDLTASEPPPPSENAKVMARPPIQGLTVYSATVEQLPVKEVAIDGRPRGALSYAVARGLEGGAASASRAVTAGGLKNYVVPVVVQQSANTQAPQFLVTEPDLELLPPSAALRLALPELRDVRLTVLGGQAVTPAGAVLTADKTAADLLFDPARRQLLNSGGDVLASGLDNLQSAVDGRRVLDAFGRAMQLAGVGLQTRIFAPGEQRPAGADRIYLKDERVRFELEPSAFRFHTVFNVSANGVVQFQWPITAQRDPLEWTRGEPLSFDAPVSPPFGSDTLVFISTPVPLQDLHLTLMDIHNKAKPLEAYRAVQAALDGKAFKLGLQAAYTCERLEKDLCDTMLASPR
jgi:hypothetical protein